MDEVSLETLLLSCECDVQWGSRGQLTVHRTIELHTNNILYCFVEPRNSMAKHVREKVYVEGCHVVDAGSYSGGVERLLLFLANHDYTEKVDLLGNHQACIFAPAAKQPPSAPAKTATGLPTADYVVQLFIADKMAKWRFLRALQRASLEYPQLFPTSPTGAALCGSMSQRTDGGAASQSAFASFAVPNHFESRVLRQAPAPLASATHSRQSSGVSVLSNHEVLQLSDVLREYEDMQRKKAAAVEGRCVLASSAAQEDVRAAPVAGEELNEACSPEAAVEGAIDAPQSPMASPAAPARLQHSPLYVPCISCDAANQACADCGAAFPSWCILQPFGSFVCIECVGVHRQLWSNKCRGAELDLWPAADVAFMQQRGNAIVNAELEYCVAFPANSVEAALHVDPPVKPVAAYSTIDVRESYIKWKYEEQLFVPQRHPHAKEPVPPRPDPVGAEHARLAAAVAAGASPASDGDAYASDAPFPSPTQPHQRAFLRDDGPPRYAGLLDVIVKELVGPESITGAVCVLTNGFQTLRTHVGRQLLHMRHSTAWDEHLQVGVEDARRKPIYCTIYRAKGELLATGEVWLEEEVFQPGASCMFAATLAWNQLHKKPDQRSAAERWEMTFLASYQPLL